MGRVAKKTYPVHMSRLMLRAFFLFFFPPPPFLTVQCCLFFLSVAFLGSTVTSSGGRCLENMNLCERRSTRPVPLLRLFLFHLRHSME